ncbi:MAG: VOC family protein [Candidatus Paceibacterota bacterium]
MPSIKHIEFWVSNKEKSLAFYVSIFKLIGWQQVDTNSFTDGNTKIYFIEQSVNFNKNIGPRHICFLAESRDIVERVADFLKASNSFILRGPMNYTYKNRSAYTIDFKDPDGYILEVATKSV